MNGISTPSTSSHPADHRGAGAVLAPAGAGERRPSRADLLLRGRHHPLTGRRGLSTARGMHRWYDWLGWIGGYPFEVAKPEEIFDFYRRRGFALTRLLTQRGGLGCNEFVCRKIGPVRGPGKAAGA